MDKIIFHVPYEKMITLRYLFKKEEEFKSVGEFFFKITTGTFFKRINKLEEILIKDEEFNSLKEDSRKILEYIKVFKEEHCHNVMVNEKYSCMLIFSKNENSDIGFSSWTGRFDSFYLISLKNEEYEKKRKLCHLTEKEEKFNFKYQKKFNFLILFFREDFFYDGRYNIPTEFIINFKRKYVKEIRDKCCHGNFVCPSDNLCLGHKFIFFLEKVFEAITHCVIEEKIFYRYFLFKIKRDYDNFYSMNDDLKISGWDFIPANPKDLSNLSYSKRLAFLN